MGKRIGFVSTRFCGTDGVTLEAAKWADVLTGVGHECFWFAGELDREPEASFLVPEAHFHHPENRWIASRVFGCKRREPEVSDRIHTLAGRLKEQLHRFIAEFAVDLVIAQNVLTIPMHISLGVALTETIAETLIPTIAHHHDFYWERTRFSVSAVGDYLRMAFPPSLPNIAHVTINSMAQEELALRTGLSSIVIPNVVDFENPPRFSAECKAEVRRSLGLEPEDIVLLQPTRIVQRKGIEHAIELVRELGDPRCKLVISHEAGDEGYEYRDWLEEHARASGVDLRLVKTSVSDPFNHRNCKQGNGSTLWEIYPHADFITYPSLYEGFGNAFLEAVYFSQPLLINRYATFVRDIEPMGFDLVAMDGFLTHRNVAQVRELLVNPERRRAMVEKNYAIAARHFSFAVLRKHLNYLLINFFGMDG
ncbi:MAG: glycosyltransferase family 4 protein [Desulfobacteraceae bacterium]|jgi:glycosyltransferase involved in cell wall biosynthesis|nr:glycosyltransferase family 4 protein [Desulfobacteraceae bacterium]